MTEHPNPSSPAWGATTKLVVALTFVAILAGLFVQFHAILGPLLMAFVLAYLLHPVAGFLQRTSHFSWQIAVALIYLLFLVLMLGLLTLSGVGLVQQIQSLVVVVQDNLTALPDLIQHLSGQVYQFGPFQFDFRTLDLQQLSNQLLGMIQPLLGQTGSILSAVAGGAAQFLGWALFVLLISYFVLAESGGLRRRIVWFDIPGYAGDVHRLGSELALIWNAFLRGQVIIFLLTTVTYTIVLSLLGVRYAIGIAFLAGLAKFVPYIGPFITWTTLALVSYFQPFRPLGLTPLAYTVIAVGLALLIDQIFDNIVTPRIIAQALRVHPAGVLVAAIVAANLLGLLGVVVAAPMLATAMLFWRYTMRKMLDLDPWPEPETQPPPPPASRFLVRLRRAWRDAGERRAKSR
jgi:predicted PurR-regulated permease PerM